MPATAIPFPSLAGSELFTGNVGAMTYGLASGTVRWVPALYNLIVSYIGNLIGSLFLVYFFMVLGYASPFVVHE